MACYIEAVATSVALLREAGRSAWMVYVHTQMVLFHRSSSSIMQFVASAASRGRTSKSMRWKQTASIIFAGRLTNLSSLSSSQMFASQFYKSKIYISVHPRSLRRILRHFMVVSLLLSLLITLRMIVAINPGKCPRSCSLKGGVEIIKHLSYKGRRILVNVVGKK